MYESLKVGIEAEGRLWTLEFDHGRANEIGSAELRDLERLAAALRADPVVVALVSFSRRVTSRGTPVFVAGANVTERVGWDAERVKAHVGWQRETLAALRAAPVLHVAVVNGLALGWGTEWLLTADYRIAADGAEFALPETGLGILPGAGGTSLLWQEIGPAQAMRLGMTGERIGAEEALRIGLVQERAVDLEAGLARARALAARAARNSPTAMAAFKAGLQAARGNSAAVEAAAYARCVDSGQAAIGRASFAAIQAGETPAWGPRQT
jgi:enoyl-CoA hydratase/carnithine racemase